MNHEGTKDAKVGREVRDKHGRVVEPGDLLKVLTYVRARNRRKMHSYKLAMRGMDIGVFLPDQYGWSTLWLVDVGDLYAQQSFSEADRCPVSALRNADFEIVDGGGRGGKPLWCDRPTHAVEASK